MAYLQTNRIINPQYVITDFERALMNSTRILGTNTNTSGCFLHFGQSIWRKIQSIGMAESLKGFHMCDYTSNYF